MKFVHIYFWLILCLDISIVWFIHSTMDNSKLTIINNSNDTIDTVVVDLKTQETNISNEDETNIPNEDETNISNEDETNISNEDGIEISNEDEDMLISIATNTEDDISEENHESEIELDDFDYNKI